MRKINGNVGNLVLRHKSKGLLVKVPCQEHDHSACWVFEDDISIAERFDKEPVRFKNEKECMSYSKFLLSIDYPTFVDAIEFVNYIQH